MVSLRALDLYLGSETSFGAPPRAPGNTPPPIATRTARVAQSSKYPSFLHPRNAPQVFTLHPCTYIHDPQSSINPQTSIYPNRPNHTYLAYQPPTNLCNIIMSDDNDCLPPGEEGESSLPTSSRTTRSRSTKKSSSSEQGHKSESSDKILHLHDIMGVFFAMADSHPEEVEEGEFKEFEESHYRPAHEWLLKEAYGGADATFLQNTNYPLLLRSMKEVMEPIKKEVETLDEELFPELYLAAFTAGDGSLIFPHSRFDSATDRGRKIPRLIQILAIKGAAPHPFKEWLSSHGWKTYNAYAYRKVDESLLTIYPPCLVIAFQHMLSFKKLLWMAVCELGACIRLGGIQGNKNSYNLIAHTILVVVFSWLNSFHGIMMSEQWFADDFQKMANKDCYLDFFLAGMIGSDGGIYDTYRIFQSNRRWCKALAKTIKKVYSLEKRPNVCTSNRPSSARQRAVSTLRIHAEASEKLAPRVASFDMNRKDQHIVYLIRRMVIHAGVIPNKKRIQAFLKGLAKYIRRVHQS